MLPNSLSVILCGPEEGFSEESTHTHTHTHTHKEMDDEFVYVGLYRCYKEACIPDLSFSFPPLLLCLESASIHIYTCRKATHTDHSFIQDFLL